VLGCARARDIHDIVMRATVTLKQQPGDVMILDNFRFMHGRNAFTGPRDMQTVMADAAF
jgi:alpha-ketoglutarate-dependent taurine dioxygenase